MTKNHRFEKRIACKTVGTMKPGRRAFSCGVKINNGSPSPFICFNAAAAVMGRGCYGYHVPGYINAYRQAFFINVGKVMYEFFFFHVPAVEPDMLSTCNF